MGAWRVQSGVGSTAWCGVFLPRCPPAPGIPPPRFSINPHPQVSRNTLAPNLSGPPPPTGPPPGPDRPTFPAPHLADSPSKRPCSRSARLCASCRTCTASRVSPTASRSCRSPLVSSTTRVSNTCRRTCSWCRPVSRPARRPTAYGQGARWMGTLGAESGGAEDLGGQRSVASGGRVCGMGVGGHGNPGRSVVPGFWGGKAGTQCSQCCGRDGLGREQLKGSPSSERTVHFGENDGGGLAGRADLLITHGCK